VGVTTLLYVPVAGKIDGATAAPGALKTTVVTFDGRNPALAVAVPGQPMRLQESPAATTLPSETEFAIVNVVPETIVPVAQPVELHDGVPPFIAQTN
jgi:hypothetical protein